MPYFSYQGQQCYYRACGEGRPLLLLHGNTASGAMFCDVMEEFAAQGRRVLAPDFLGCGRSARIKRFPVDLWYDEAMQALCFLQEQSIDRADVIGTSGGALAAINLALEAPKTVRRLIADSFAGERAQADATAALAAGRAASKQDKMARSFYRRMNGDDWEAVVDRDTAAILEHAKTIGAYFHRDISALQAPILLTGNAADPLLPEGFCKRIYPDIVRKVGRGVFRIFENSGHPAMLTNGEDFLAEAKRFFDGD